MTFLIPDVVNAWENGDGAFAVSMRVGDQLFAFELSDGQAVQLADQLRLLTRTTD